MISEEKNYFTVSEFNRLIQAVVQAGFPEPVWVCGEIQGYDRSRTKRHIFFELCEKDSEKHDVLARIGLVIFERKKEVLQDIIEANGNLFALKDDIEVKFLCRPDFYPPHGAMRLTVESIDPFYTLGRIAAEKQKIIALLKKDGTLDRNKQLPVPEVPLRIGLITSYDSAAYNDFLSELSASGFGFDVACRNTLMQGKGAEEAVCRALEEFYANAQWIDVIVITRGGGSAADLACFDSAKIARTVAMSPVPVLSGIGHEIDLSVTDLAACVYQKTPTAVARFLLERTAASLTVMDAAAQDVCTLAAQYLKGIREGLQSSALLLQQGIGEFLKEHDRGLARIEQSLCREPMRLLTVKQQAHDVRKQAFLSAARGLLKQQEERLAHCRRFVEAAHPDHICRRGFSVTRTAAGGLVRSVEDVQAGEKVITRVIDGAFESVVEGQKGPAQSGTRKGGEDGGIKICPGHGPAQ